MLSIIILSLNQWEWTHACIQSVRKYTTLPYEIIVVDNGSSDRTVEALLDLATNDPQISVLLNSCNKGFAGGNNLGISLARSDYVLLLNNDTLVTEGWLESLLRVFSDYPGTGIVGPMSNYVAGPQIVKEARYQNVEEMEAFASGWRASHRNETFSLRSVIGFCMLIGRGVIEAIGGLDPLFGVGNFEDLDYCYRTLLAGFEIRVAKDVYIHHQGSLTFKSEKIDYLRIMQKNWELFKAKWGLDPRLPLKKCEFVLCKDKALRQHIALPKLEASHECKDEGRCWVDRAKKPGSVKRAGAVPIESVPQPQVSANLEKAFSSSYLTSSSTANVSAAPAVSIVIPTYQNLHLTRQCIEGILHNTAEVPYEIIVVDNHSTDGTESYLREMEKKGVLRAVFNPVNMGFACACNKGAQAAQSPFVLFLNNDTFPMERWLNSLLQTALRDEQAAIVGSKLLYPDGKVQHAGMELIEVSRGQKLARPIPGHPHRFFDADAPEVNQYRELDMVTGACILVRKEIFFLLSGFDEVYKNGVEDVDLCFRARLAGYKVVYQPRSVLIHHEGQSPGRFDKENVSQNLLIYFGRWANQFGLDGRLIIPKPTRIIRSLRSILTGDHGTPSKHFSAPEESQERGLRI